MLDLLHVWTQRMLVVWAVLAGVAMATAAASDGNMIQNPTFEAGQSGKITGWQYAAGLAGVTQGRGEAGPMVRLHTRARLVLSQQIAVERERDYIASLWVKSDDRLVLQFGPATGAYHKQGQWQQVVVLINAGAAESINLAIELRSLTGKAADYLVRDVLVRPASDPGKPEPRPRFDRTAVVEDDQPAATIVANASPAMQSLAQQVQAAVRERTGVTLPIVTDTDATTDTPALRSEMAGQHLILIGRLGTNRALWTAYNRYLAAVDGYYPGGDGYVVRTASNVMRNGKNHIVLGGSHDAGVERAVARFVTHHVAQMARDGRAWSLPWLLDVELDGECLAAFEASDELWRTDPHSSALPPVQPGYGTVRRWYENAMGYYWSGWPSYEQRARELVEPLIADMAYTHHYLGEFMVRVYDMVDDTPLLSDEQRAGMDHLIQTNFWTMSSGPDATWMTTFSPPYDNIKLVNRHQISPWTADLKLAEFLADYCQPAGDLGRAVQFRLSEKMAFMDHLVTHRWGPSAPGASLTEQIEEPVAAMARYALDHDRYVFFESGNAARGLFLDRIDHRTGLLVRPAGRVDHNLIMGMLAHYHRDGRYKTLLENVPTVMHASGQHFQGRYVNEVHRWTPGPELTSQPLESWTGVRVPELMGHVKRGLHAMDGNTYFVPDDLDPDDVLNMAVFRGGFDKDDDYFAINGIQETYPPGTILKFSSRNVSWLGVGGGEVFSPASGRYLDQNAVHVLPTDRWLSSDVRYPALAMREWAADLQRGGGAGITLSPFMDTTWRREVVWIASGVFLVRDQLEALRDGTFDIAVSWRPAGLLAWDGHVLQSRSGRSELRVMPLSADLAVRQTIDAYQAGAVDEARFQLARSGPLKAGERVSAVTMLQARAGTERAVHARLADRRTVVIKGGGDDGEIEQAATVVSFGPRDDAALTTDAAAIVIGPGRLDVMHATRLSLGGQTVLAVDGEAPASFSVNLAAGTLRVDRMAGSAFDRATVTLPGWRVMPGESDTHRLERVEQADAGDDALNLLLTRTAAALAANDLPVRTDVAGRAPVADADEPWAEQWRYDGLLRPALVRGVRQVRDDVVDLGRVVSLDEIRAVHYRGPYRPASLPRTLAVAVPDEDGRMPALDGDGWRQIDVPAEWQPNVRSGNYGEATPDDEVFQLAKLDGLRARWVRAERAGELYYFDRAQREARRSMLVQVHDMTGDGQGQVLVKPDIWPKFIRPRQLEDDMFALLNADGGERFQREARTVYQDIAVLDYFGDGGRQIATAEVDGQLAIIDADGETRRRFDLWQLHQSFHASYGRDNTRQPAGGFTMPYAIGTWRPGADGVASLVIGRYGGFSFIDSHGDLDGVVMPGGYVVPAVLPDSVDFDGDGQREQLALSRGSLLVLHGDRDERITEPNRNHYYPQVYHADRIREPAWEPSIDGAPVRLLEVLPWNQTQRHLLVVREHYLGMFDGQDRTWSFAWQPLTRIVAAATIEAASDTLTVFVVTDDGLLWRLHWSGRLDELASFDTLPMPATVRGIAQVTPGRAILATDAGLMLLDAAGDALTRIADGDFTSVQPLTSDGDTFVAVTRRGEVVRYDRSGR